MKAPYLIRIFASLLVLGQVSLLPVAAYAETAPSETPAPSESPAPTPSVAITPNPTTSPMPSTTVSPSTTPTSTPTPSSSVLPSPSPSASPIIVGDTQPTTSPSPSSSPTSVPTTASSTGPTSPTGPTGPTGTIPKYALDMLSRTWIPTDQSSFTWDPKSGYWLSPLYQYDPARGYYEIFAPGVVMPTNLLTAPGAVKTPLGLVAPGSQKYELAKSLGLLPQGTSIGNTGPGSTNAVDSTATNGATFDLTNLVNVINSVSSNATSGNAAAVGNTQAGNVSTGSAAVVANLVNLLSSAWSWSNGALNYFVNNIFGNKTGDITLRPSVSTPTSGGGLGQTAIGTTGPNSKNSISSDKTNDLTVKQSDGANITNNLDLAAISGNAKASGNTVAGNATSGDAVVQANVINLINSYINSGNSFFGVLNLFGNLNGDVLFPTGFLDSTKGSNPIGSSNAGTSIGTTGPESLNSISQNTNNTANVAATTSNSIRNNIDANAKSGNADVSGNTLAGSATTGDAKTSQSLYNLSNTNIFGDNAVLVIVNVMGHWIGHIMNMPDTGASTSALLTGGAQIGTTGPNSTNSIDGSTKNTANIDVSKTGSITNNINANAQSGDAVVTGNTKAGDAKTGSAKVATNVANIINSGINVKRWFGVLVINVFGDWFGSVGDNTSAGTVETAGRGSGTNPAVSAQTSALIAPELGNQSFGLKTPGAPKVVSSSGSGRDASPVVNQSGAAVNSSLPISANSKLASLQQTAPASTKKSAPSILIILSILTMLAAAGLTLFEKKFRA